MIPEDVKAVARPVLAHRITVRPELWMTEVSGRRVVDEVLRTVATPSTLEPWNADDDLAGDGRHDPGHGPGGPGRGRRRCSSALPWWWC